MQGNPRQNIQQMIRSNDLEGLFEKASEFHGHYCHKVAYGVRASIRALKELGFELMDEEGGRMVAISDSPGPFCNGLQYTLGLTLGHSDFVVRDLGKLALTLVKYNNSAVRVSLRPEFLDGFSERNPELSPLLGGRYATIPVSEGMETPLRIIDLSQHMLERIDTRDEAEKKKKMERMMGAFKGVVFSELKRDDNEMFNVEKKEIDFAQYAPICQCTHPIVICDTCGEAVFEPYVRIKQGRKSCIECAGESYDLLVKGKMVRANLAT